jgi:hypothetical protein
VSTMPAESIHVEVEDEVPAIIERIRRSPAEEVHLLLPPRARFGQSRFNFQLLKQYSTRLGKQVAISSPDPAVQRLAEESGFGAARPAPDEPRPPARPAPAGPRPAMPVASAQQAPFPAAPPGQPVPPRGPRPGAVPPPGGRVLPGGTPPAGQTPLASRLAGLGRITRPAQPTLARIRIGAPRRLPSQLARYQPARYVLYAGAIVVLLAGMVAVLFYVPSATVTLVAQAQPFSTNVELTADPGKAPVRVRSAASSGKQLSAPGQATGTKVTPGQNATGQFTYVNNCGFALQIANGQRLQSAAGMVFAQMGDAQANQGQPATVTVKAIQTGAAGNVGAGAITGIEANQFPCLTGTNQAPMAGGTDDQKQTVIQSSDIQTVKVDLERQLRASIADDLKAGIRPGEVMTTQPIFGNESFTTTHNVDDPSPTFTATLKLDAEGDYYQKDDVDRAFTARLSSKVPKDQQLTTNRVAVNYTVTAAAGGHMDFTGSANGYIAPRIDLLKIKGELAGKPAAQAHDVLTKLPNIQRSVISQSPPLPLLPLSSSRIYIDYGVESHAPAATT